MMSHEYKARISWNRNEAEFLDGRYSRRHEWSFDGGVRVAASASPVVAPAPHSVAAAVDPEEALVASASSCHMLWFLDIARQRRFVVDSYVDEAVGVMGADSDGKVAITRITLRPQVEFSGNKIPTAAELESLHRAAHEQCYIANSLKCEVAVERPADS